MKQLQPLKRSVLNYSPTLAEPIFPINYPENVFPRHVVNVRLDPVEHDS